MIFSCFIIDAVCCVVLNEFSVLSALFTLKAHSPDIAKEWSDQITSAQVREYKTIYAHTHTHTHTYKWTSSTSKHIPKLKIENFLFCIALLVTMLRNNTKN